MKNLAKNLFSSILPITVLIVVPVLIEDDLSIQYTWNFFLGVAVMCVGLLAMITTIASFIRIGKGTLAPWSPTKKMVMVGLYQYVRNPMIMGVMIVLIGESIAIASRSIFIWSLIFFVINTIYFVLYEEPNLEKRFGDEYREYKKHVARWVPRLKPYRAE